MAGARPSRCCRCPASTVQEFAIAILAGVRGDNASRAGEENGVSIPSMESPSYEMELIGIRGFPPKSLCELDETMSDMVARCRCLATITSRLVVARVGADELPDRCDSLLGACPGYWQRLLGHDEIRSLLV
jgi:hypothetical protein